MSLTTEVEKSTLLSALPELLPLTSFKELPSRIQHRLRLRAFKSHFHFIINMCEYWILLFPL